jgi:[ribosomal protein S18]-alanine N-acetyltransferase
LEGAERILSIRGMETRDVLAVMSIQSACPEIAQWTVRDYTRVAKGDMVGWVADEGELAGFIVARRVARDVEILNFAVRPERRRKGIGEALLREAMAWGAAFAAEKAFLEVRVSNLAAIRFYDRKGFEVTGRRPRYYSAPIEDALVLTASLRVA